MPGQSKPVFSLTTTFAPSKRQTLAAFMAVNSAPGDGYGKIQVLQLPRQTTIPGPSQVQNNFESDPEVSQQLSLLRRGGSDVELGNLLSLPVAGGMLYVEPVYVLATGAEGYPLLRKVLVSFGQTVAFEDTLSAALTKVFGTETAGGQNPGGDNGGTTNPDTPNPTPTGSLQAQLTVALADAQAAYDEGQEALKEGDFAAYGAAQKKLESALARAESLAQQITGGSPTPSPTPSPEPSGSTAPTSQAPA